MKVLITGANGFVGKNLQLQLSERKDVEVVCFTRDHSVSDLPALLRGVGFIFHLAGINRPQDPQEFMAGNVVLTDALCAAISACGYKVPVVYISSAQAVQDNEYGISKRAAEKALFNLKHNNGISVHIFRLPNIFGKWCKPNYNSVVATFCNNIARDLPIQINDPTTSLSLVYVDDVVERFIQLMDDSEYVLGADEFEILVPQYTTTVGALAHQIQAFKNSRSTLITERVGNGLVRALYSTYVSYLPIDSFSYQIKQHRDSRGVFVEMLKTPDCGQISYFIAHPGITRGGHYHHSKTEKFLVIKGLARFKFRHMHTGETYELVTSGGIAEVVETAPGWSHDITNIGDDEMVVMLWANELFDHAKPDTFAYSL